VYQLYSFVSLILLPLSFLSSSWFERRYWTQELDDNKEREKEGRLTGTKFVSTGPAMNASCPATRFRNSILVEGPRTWYCPRALWSRDRASVRSLP